MTDRCQACDRKFERISDYPLVYVAKFERLDIPSGIVFPDYNPTAYVGPKSEFKNPRPPQEVLNFFKENKRAEEFEHEGCTWHREGKWDSGYYHRSRNYVKEVILAQLNPYFDTLKKLVGQEVPTTQVLPHFGFEITRDRYWTIIPETLYSLNLERLDEKGGSHMLLQKNLPVPNLETSQPTRKLAFVITGPGGGSEANLWASVGGLAYEGRVHK